MNDNYHSDKNHINDRRNNLMKASLILFGIMLIGLMMIGNDSKINELGLSELSEVNKNKTLFSIVSSQGSESAGAKENKNETESPSTSIGKWKRFEVILSNPSWSGNPFDLDLFGIFEHIPTGRKINQLGFYAGDNIWKIYFMPDSIGEWTYKTQSTDKDLHGLTGSLNCIDSDLPGRLIGDGRRWLLEDSREYVAPIMLPTREWFKRSNTNEGIDDFIFWANNTAGALIIGTTLIYFDGAQDEIPYLKGQEGDLFNIPMWDRLNSHYDMLRDRGMGFYIMFYSDDDESPNIHKIKAKSPEEVRLFKYAIARFSAYPIVMWDTGIDIRETTDNEWIDWFADWFNANDPWKHPVSSRTGGGSGGKFPGRGTYYSDGASQLPSHTEVVKDWVCRSVPTAFTDRWREDYSRGGFDREMIRRAAWEIGLVGGIAIYVGGNENGGYLNETYANDFKAAPDLGLRTQFFREEIIDFKLLTPSDRLILAGNGVILAANNGKEYVVYDYNGGSFTINLEDVIGSLNAKWFNPRTGEWIDGNQVQGGGARIFITPTKQDWVLHLFGEGAGFNSLLSHSKFEVSAPNAFSLENISGIVYRLFLPRVTNC